jgi:hypothetical protein
LNGSICNEGVVTLWFYKHGITRRTIGLGEDGRAYVGGRPTSVWEAVEYVYADIEAMGHTRDTPYTDDLIAERSRALRAEGWSIVHSAPCRYTD